MQEANHKGTCELRESEYMDMSVPSAQFFCKPIIALENKICFQKGWTQGSNTLKDIFCR